MKYLTHLLVIILLSSCSDTECYKCKDGNATIEISGQSSSLIDIAIPNFAVEGQEAIRLVSASRLDSNPVVISDASLILKGENSEFLFEDDPAPFIEDQSSVVIPASLLYSGNQFVEGQIHFEFSATDSVTNLFFSIKGTFLFMSCETFLDPNTEIKNQADCRNNRITTQWSDGEYGC